MDSKPTVTVAWGEETFTPAPFNSFRVGPFSMTCEVKAGETITQAIDRAYTELEEYAQSIVQRKSKRFAQNLNGLKGK